MELYEKDNLFQTFKGVIESIIEDKRKNPKNHELLNNYTANINLGLQVKKDYIFWVNLVASEGNYQVGRNKLTNYDLELIASPEDFLYFSNRQNSTIHMVAKKNKYGKKKLQIGKGISGRNLGKLLKLSKILVLDKVKKI